MDDIKQEELIKKVKCSCIAMGVLVAFSFSPLLYAWIIHPTNTSLWATLLLLVILAIFITIFLVCYSDYRDVKAGRIIILNAQVISIKRSIGKKTINCRWEVEEVNTKRIHRIETVLGDSPLPADCGDMFTFFYPKHKTAVVYQPYSPPDTNSTAP